MRRAIELQEANAGLRAASATTNEFLSRVSHELRTPLTAIVGFSELLSTRGDVDPATGQQWIGLIRSAAEHLVGLVDDVLELSRVRVGELSLSLRPVPLRPLVDEVLELLSPLAASRDVRLAPVSWTASAGYAFADDQRLRQVLINLVSNAVKYNRRGGEVRIAVRPVDDHGVRLAVEDTGRGIEPELLPRLFAPFERLDEPSRGIGGHGPRARALARPRRGDGRHDRRRQHRGRRLDVLGRARRRRGAGGGADQRRRPARARRCARTRSERRLLYVEDTAANVLLVEEMLRRRPSIRADLGDARRARLASAQRERPDAILLDLHLPDLPGEEVLARLQADEATRSIPVAILTADVTARRAEPLMEAGAAAYLTKPIALRELLDVVDTLLGERLDDASPSARPRRRAARARRELARPRAARAASGRRRSAARRGTRSASPRPRRSATSASARRGRRGWRCR